MFTLGHSKFTSLRKEFFVSAAALTIVAALSTASTPADAMSFGRGFGGGGHMMGGGMGGMRSMPAMGGGMRSLGAIGGLRSMGGHSVGGLGHAMGGGSALRSIGHARHGITPGHAGISVDNGHGGWKPYKPGPKAPVNVAGPKPTPGHAGISVDDGHGGWKPYTPGPKSPVTAAGPKPPAGHAGISVDDGHGGWKPYQPRVTDASTPHHHVDLNGDREAGHGMRVRAGTDKPLTDWVEVYDPDAGQTVKSVDNGDGTHTVTALVSYGSTPETGLVRVDDLPRIKAKVQNDCRLLQAKVNKLTADLGRLQRVFAAVQDLQTVAVPGVTGAATSFRSAEGQQFVAGRVQQDIVETQKLLDQYQADLARCLKEGN